MNCQKWRRLSRPFIRVSNWPLLRPSLRIPWAFGGGIRPRTNYFSCRKNTTASQLLWSFVYAVFWLKTHASIFHTHALMWLLLRSGFLFFQKKWKTLVALSACCEIDIKKRIPSWILVEFLRFQCLIPNSSTRFIYITSQVRMYRYHACVFCSRVPC